MLVVPGGREVEDFDSLYLVDVALSLQPRSFSKCFAHSRSMSFHERISVDFTKVKVSQDRRFISG